MTPQWLNTLSEIVSGDIGRLFNKFKIKYREGQNRIYDRCPVHDSDNHNSLTVYLDGHTLPFVWKCWTNHCENTYKCTLVGFVQGTLSREEGREISLKEAVRFLLDLYNIDPSTVKVTPESIDKKNFLARTNTVVQQKQTTGISRDKVRAKLKIPADYYIKRGYTTEVLDKYDVGLCDNPKKDMFGRVVVPVYDFEAGNNKGVGAVGFLARATQPYCGRCKSFHLQTVCPSNTQKFSKWRVQGISTGSYLYNYWYAQDLIKTSSTAIIVESPGNVWRLEEAGFHNSVALFGTKFTDEQQFLLEKLGVMNLVIIMDNDLAGEKASAQIKKQCGKYYNLKFLTPPAGDVGEMTVEEVKCLIGNCPRVQ